MLSAISIGLPKHFLCRSMLTCCPRDVIILSLICTRHGYALENTAATTNYSWLLSCIKRSFVIKPRRPAAASQILKSLIPSNARFIIHKMFYSYIIHIQCKNSCESKTLKSSYILSFVRNIATVKTNSRYNNVYSTNR